MDRQAFKQRMRNLKSYRENNPGKGYWDWSEYSFRSNKSSKLCKNTKHKTWKMERKVSRIR